MSAASEAPVQLVYLVYLVAGVEKVLANYRIALRLLGADDDHPLVAGGGHIGMVTDLMPYADLVGQYVEAKIADTNTSFPGVFEYEVTELLGEWYASHPDCMLVQFSKELERRGEAFFAQSS